MFNILIPAGGGVTTVVQSNPALLNNTEANSANILAAVDALAAAIFTDSNAFTVAVSKLMAMGFLVNPTDVLTAGEIGAPAMDEYRGLINAVTDRITKVNRVRETNPRQYNYTPYPSIIALTTSSTTTEVYIDMRGRDSLNLQFILGGGSATLTVEGTMQDDGTADSSCTYDDITQAAYGVATITASKSYADPAGFFGKYRYVKIKVVPVSATVTVHANTQVL